MSFFLSEFTRSIKTTGLKTYVSNGKNFKMASNKSGMLCPDASTNLGPSLQCDLKKIQSQKSSLKILEKKTYAAGKLASAKTISSPWPILAKVWSKSGDKMTGIPFKRPIFFNAENSCFSAGVFIFWFATQWLFIYSRNLPMKTIRIQNSSNTKSNL